MFGQKFIEIHEYTRVTSDLVYSRNDIKRPKPDSVAFPSTRPFEDVLSMDKPKALGGGNRSRNFRCFARNFPWLETDSVAIQFRGKKVGTAVTVESVLLFASLLRSMIVYIYIYIYIYKKRNRAMRGRVDERRRVEVSREWKVG